MYCIHCAILIHILFSFVMCFIFYNYMDFLSEINNQSINQSIYPATNISYRREIIHSDVEFQTPSLKFKILLCLIATHADRRLIA